MNVFFMEVVITLRVLLEFGATGIFIHTMIAPSGCNFSPAAGAKDVSIYFFSAGAVLGQIVPVVSIVTGLIWRHRLGKSQTPLTSMLLNQALVVSMMIYNFFPQLRLGMHDGHAMLSWYNTLLSVATCRLLLQMWKLAADEREKNYPRRDALNRRSSIILTTVIMESHRQITDTTSTMPTYSITTPKNTRMK
ncbi:hypothetical protein JR316_0005346 [Psilocybe cubensis]|uniref:Uncharacterized protein n=1 Tax=Psilocybe cubensis TaxID=181762 RepID=A0ACB8H6G5_PSICU|nr:hypothetical protein JR316_0005346 [Psilocybe cubensis]KAH9483242.1 hypothetical protein JR316_0005346 [Psilocybe cubensis]